MNNLKEKIAELEKIAKNNWNFNSFYEITKIALERNELIKLLSADSSYIYNSKEELWLAPDKKMGPDPRPIVTGAIINALEKIYYETKSPKIKINFISSIKEMISGTPQQFFLAIEYFRIISEEIQSNRRHSYSKFDYFKEYNGLPTLEDELKPFIIKAIEERRDFLKENSAYELNLWEYCKYHSGKLVECGLIGFMPEIK